MSSSPNNNINNKKYCCFTNEKELLRKKAKPIDSERLRTPINKKSFLTLSGLSNYSSDRCIPYSISPNYNCFPSNFNSEKSNPKSKTKSNKNETQKKNEDTYQKALLADLLYKTTPMKLDLTDPAQTLSFINGVGSKKKINFTPVKNQRSHSKDMFNITKSKSKINSENTCSKIKDFNFDNNLSTKIIKPFKEIYCGFEENDCLEDNYLENYIVDNYYYHLLDMYDLDSILISTVIGGTFLLDYSKEKMIPHFFPLANTDGILEVYCNKFLPGRKNVFISSTKNGLVVTNIDKEKSYLFLPNFSPKNRKVQTMSKILVFDIYSNYMFTGQEDGFVQFLDLRQPDNRGILYHHPDSIVCNIKYSPKNQMVITGGNDDVVNIFDFRKMKIIEQIKHNGAVKAIGLNYMENFLITGGGKKDRKIKLFNMKTLKLKSETVASSQITSCNFIKDNSIFISFGFNDKNSALYSLDYEKIYGHESLNNPFNSYVFSSQESSENEEFIDIFKKEYTFEEHKRRNLFTAKDKVNGNLVATASERGIKIFKLDGVLKSNNSGLDEWNNIR